MILGIETSCDETGASLVKKEANGKLTILSNIVATSLDLHAETGGIIPESAAREQLKYILPVIKQAIKSLSNPKKDIDAIAVTVGPGLIGSLLVGVETAKTLSYIWNKPIIPVNHLFGHIYANWLDGKSLSSRAKRGDLKKIASSSAKITPRNDIIQFPLLALVVSGNHTDLVLMKSHRDVTVLGATRDDAAGEAFDKIGRLLGLAYPAGPTIAKLAEKGNQAAYNFPRPMKYSKDYDFSFSGLKTAVLRETKMIKTFDDKTTTNLCASAQEAIVDLLVFKTIKAAKEHRVKSILLGGGVAANEKLRQALQLQINETLPHIKLFIPDKNFCTDNGAMIAAAAFFRNKSERLEDITVDPELYY